MPLPKSILCAKCKKTYPEGWRRCPYCGHDAVGGRREAQSRRFMEKKVQEFEQRLGVRRKDERRPGPAQRPPRGQQQRREAPAEGPQTGKSRRRRRRGRGGAGRPQETQPQQGAQRPAPPQQPRPAPEGGGGPSGKRRRFRRRRRGGRGGGEGPPKSE